MRCGIFFTNIENRLVIYSKEFFIPLTIMCARYLRLSLKVEAACFKVRLHVIDMALITNSGKVGHSSKLEYD